MKIIYFVGEPALASHAWKSEDSVQGGLDRETFRQAEWWPTPLCSLHVKGFWWHFSQDQRQVKINGWPGVRSSSLFQQPDLTVAGDLSNKVHWALFSLGHFAQQISIFSYNGEF